MEIPKFIDKHWPENNIPLPIKEQWAELIELYSKEQLLIQRVSHCFFYDNELNHIRQWFNTTIDQNQDKDIEKTEWELALKIHKYLNITPENRIVKNCG